MLTAGLGCLLTFGGIGRGLAAGVTAELDKYSGPAKLQLQVIERFHVQVTLEPGAEKRPVGIRVRLPITGRDAWPIADVAVTDADGRPVPVLRSGIEWHNLLLTVAPRRQSYVIAAVDPGTAQAPAFPEKERTANDAGSGVSAGICRFLGDRKAALSIRFDDSHPTHLSKAVPILNEYGFRGTFMVNPGGHPPNSRRRSSFADHRAEWEAVAQRGRHEFANHSLNHTGATNDEEMDHEIGAAARAIWKLFPAKSKLTALNLGGGTRWITSQTLRHYLDKYHHFDASSGSTGMDDVYRNRVQVFERLLQQHLERGLWYRVHYHYLGPGLSTTEENFRAVLEIARRHQESLWIAGMSDIHKYQTERRAAKLALTGLGADRIQLDLSCASDPTLYDQPLTISLTLPKSWAAERVGIRNVKGGAPDVSIGPADHGKTLLFDAEPRDSRFVIERH